MIFYYTKLYQFNKIIAHIKIDVRPVLVHLYIRWQFYDQFKVRNLKDQPTKVREF